MSDQLVQRLQQAGYRLTAPRRAVICVLESGRRHFSPCEILERGRAIYPALSRATVYRTLDLLAELGLLRPVYLGDGGARVVCVGEQHHHLVCLGCGHTIHFEECVVDDLAQALSERFDFQVTSHLLELYGLCENCRRGQQQLRERIQ
ncbi:MAG: transcriptional repressor [Anaerolineae bacterium]|nr:transcriptional repressor [Anaerolineae bacterium]